MKKRKQFFLGLDISKLFFDVALLIVYGNSKQEIPQQRFTNDTAGLQLFEQWLKRNGVIYDDNSLVIIENTGIESPGSCLTNRNYYYVFLNNG